MSFDYFIGPRHLYEIAKQIDAACSQPDGAISEFGLAEVRCPWCIKKHWVWSTGPTMMKRCKECGE